MSVRTQSTALAGPSASFAAYGWFGSRLATASWSDGVLRLWRPRGETESREWDPAGEARLVDVLGEVAAGSPPPGPVLLAWAPPECGEVLAVACGPRVAVLGPSRSTDGFLAVSPAAPLAPPAARVRATALAFDPAPGAVPRLAVGLSVGGVALLTLRERACVAAGAGDVGAAGERWEVESLGRERVDADVAARCADAALPASASASWRLPAVLSLSWRPRSVSDVAGLPDAVVAGDEAGRALVWVHQPAKGRWIVAAELGDANEVSAAAPSPVTALAWAPSHGPGAELVAVARSSRLALHSLSGALEPPALSAPRTVAFEHLNEAVEQLEWNATGVWLAGTGANGAGVALWRFDSAGKWRLVDRIELGDDDEDDEEQQDEDDGGDMQE